MVTQRSNNVVRYSTTANNSTTVTTSYAIHRQPYIIIIMLFQITRQTSKLSFFYAYISTCIYTLFIKTTQSILQTFVLK